MFGRGPPPSAPTASADWGEMYIHQKLQHLVDHAADTMFRYAKYWTPAVGVAMFASIFIFSGPNFVPEALTLAMPVISPVPGAPQFGTKMPEGGPGGPPPGPDDEEA